MDISLLPTFKALADSTRIRILNLLADQELNVNEIVKVLSTTQSGISRHLKILADSGLVKCRRDGLWSFFRTNANGGHAELMGLLKASFKKDKQL
ncbi:MAG: ArsR family transcriptional regulator [Spirochaetaceae bacterium]|nr:MAG: ArsR family transcriptional regulator [Spirochaetaceae bacterium]